MRSSILVQLAIALSLGHIAIALPLLVTREDEVVQIEATAESAPCPPNGKQRIWPLLFGFSDITKLLKRSELSTTETSTNAACSS
ncbi:hypothetical protein HBH56_174870 [Parastagonospora nodorum]|uniref:Uncharacterized protein n=1 Tax=Phaeosphaeria nodorum (strain SN15 / ATCC MYA-4574 / FGSC 10173) TaxID=321614 RepID=Q0V414_PHANO|nr:hypothetical protein SNOG_01250 [Parastagonospora nodorum SN15]KAH3908427.1 hypothetical protein HBH56_174870 [Parastagonospora nodorum]EAT90899.1 hypothetical protein SNOG_01250 [Parastagonospora nodorum SN15]KAH3926306.1 hypothetical protein HBH54_168280 [Parastagonospora nodorum]KAH3965655.1 hypothetical protein HBH52_204940 [Parastagonospora nodorum]KAH4007351.1 hypothetical protein HBI10_008890 [Parastagonospora nodorum]